MKAILVPVDYSLNSKSALLYALKMAQKANLDVVVFHAFYPTVAPPAALEIPSVVPELEKEKCLELEQYVKNCKNTVAEDLTLSYQCVEDIAQEESSAHAHPGKAFHAVAVEEPTHPRYAARITCIAKMGTAYEQIIRAAAACKAEFTVMGMRGSGALSQVLLGSTTVSVMRNSKIPVLGVPLNTKFNGLKSVVFALDLSKQPDIFLLNKLRDFVKTFRSKLQVLHINRQKNQYAENASIQPALEVLDQQLFDVDYKVRLHQRTDVAAGIREYLQENKPDLLILSPQKHSALEKLLDKSVTAKMVAYNFLPLLSLPASAIEEYVVAEEELEGVEDL